MEQHTIDTLFEADWDHFRDAIIELTGETPSKEEALAVFSVLPSYIQIGAVNHGLSDPVFCEDFLGYKNLQFDTSSQMAVDDLLNHPVLSVPGSGKADLDDLSENNVIDLTKL